MEFRPQGLGTGMPVAAEVPLLLGPLGRQSGGWSAATVSARWLESIVRVTSLGFSACRSVSGAREPDLVLTVVVLTRTPLSRPSLFTSDPCTFAFISKKHIQVTFFFPNNSRNINLSKSAI